MPSVRTARPANGRPRNGSGSSRGYGWLSARPLHVLVFLTPLIVLYELGSIMYLADTQRGIIETIGARSILSSFFEAFGGATLYLPGVALVVVLLVWHVLERDRWTVRPPVLLGMLAEAVLWTFPLLVLGLLLSHGQSRPSSPGAIGYLFTQGSDPIAQLPWQARLTLSIGAGLYEELLFRLILIAAAHFVLADVMRLKSGTAGAIAALVSATAFALYHDVVPASGGVDWRLFFFYTLAGLYFASVFVLRGFGIVVGVHALYDVLVLVVEPFLRSNRTAAQAGSVLSDAIVQVLFGPAS